MFKLVAADQQRSDQSSDQISMMVTGEVVNVRAGASLNSEIIAQLAYGTMVQLDVQGANPSPEVSMLTTTGNTDWSPVILPDGRTGYIYSLYLMTTPVTRFTEWAV